MSCEAPLTGPDCSVTYAQAAGAIAFWGYRGLYLVLGALLSIVSIMELRASISTQAMKLPHPTADDAPSAVVSQQQNYQKSIYFRLIAASVFFMLCAIDPLGYNNIVGVQFWVIFSGITSFFVLSVCISLIFVVVRRIALVGSQHGVLGFFNSLYVYSQFGMVLTWIVLPIVQALVHRAYIVEAAKLSLSSIIFLMWTIGSLAYGISAVKNLKQTVDRKFSDNLSSHARSDVYMQRLHSVRVMNRLLGIASALSILFVGVQAVDAVHAIRTQDPVNFDAKSHVPHNFVDLFISGIFETIKQILCFVVLGGMRYVRVSREQTRKHIMAEKEADIQTGGEDVPLAEIPPTQQLHVNKELEDHNDEDESASSQTSIFAESNNMAA